MADTHLFTLTSTSPTAATTSAAQALTLGALRKIAVQPDGACNVVTSTATPGTDATAAAGVTLAAGQLFDIDVSSHTSFHVSVLSSSGAVALKVFKAGG